MKIICTAAQLSAHALTTLVSDITVGPNTRHHVQIGQLVD